MRLIVAERLLGEIEEDARRRLPEEACGILVGRSLPDRRVVERLTAEENVYPGDRGRRYRIAPERLLAAQQSARGAGLDIVGYYHSHPASAATPSPVDLRVAWPGVSYLIVGLSDGRVREVRSWRLEESGTGFVEEAVEYSAE